MNASVAVITPTRNRLKLLCEAMDSVRCQSFDAWEHIVIDDGSEDDTHDEVKRRMLADSRVRYVQRSSEKHGANVCRNIGIAQSSAEFIVFLDSDDLLAPDCLGRRVDRMRRNLDLDFATFQGGVFKQKVGDLHQESGAELFGDDLLRFLFFEFPWIITGPIWRRTSLLRLGYLDESLPSWQDIDLHVRAIAQGCRYLRFPEVDHHVRWQNDPAKISIEQRRSPRHLEAANSILRKLEQYVREGPGMTWVRQRALCGLYFFVAEQWVASRELSAALQSWKGIRRRRLGSALLYLSGAVLLSARRLDFPDRDLSDRFVNRWKGWVRFRTNPQLIRN
jgi:glycosyltransferase involved in cell wall biosynthesis